MTTRVTCEAVIIAGFDLIQSGLVLRLAQCYFVAAGEAAGFVCGDAAGAVAGATGEGDAAGVGVAVGALSGVDCNTDLDPVSDGKASIKATSMKAAAAPIVIFASRLAVPRGPKAVLERLLENNAPASALPGCNRITVIRTTQARMNRPYRM